MGSVTNLPTIEKTPLVILCGGRSSRMGKDKSFLPFANYDSLLEFQYSRLLPFFENIYISCKVQKFDFLKPNSSNIIFDDSKEVYSPLIALKSILSSINSSKVFILTVDTPFISPLTISKLLKKSLLYEITIAKSPNKTHNLCGVFSTSLLDKIDNMLSCNIHKIGYLIKQSSSFSVEFSNENEFLNMNSVEDYERALNMVKTDI